MLTTQSFHHLSIINLKDINCEAHCTSSKINFPHLLKTKIVRMRITRLTNCQKSPIKGSVCCYQCLTYKVSNCQLGSFYRSFYRIFIKICHGNFASEKVRKNISKVLVGQFQVCVTTTVKYMPTGSTSCSIHFEIST